ncbi:hypothetical protein KSX_46150 [Ktedonospora formicarum]|uniref:Uncharacterized protein n=1 Tax=Ktedonospora formicarum TaxID=2778364 RepID=A0A8J3MRU6_9CHLR|nr:hypothetical protein KSX_46150 [Ktedonospora formicarum]
MSQYLENATFNLTMHPTLVGISLEMGVIWLTKNPGTRVSVEQNIFQTYMRSKYICTTNKPLWLYDYCITD